MSKEAPAGELLPCPFCGGDVEEKHRHNFNAVTCATCHATVPQSGIGYGDAGKLWNRRAADRELRRGDSEMPVVAWRYQFPGDLQWQHTDNMTPISPTSLSEPLVRLSDAQAALAEKSLGHVSLFGELQNALEKNAALTAELDAALRMAADRLEQMQDDRKQALEFGDALRKDAARFRNAIAFEDNTELLHFAVMNNAFDQTAIRAEFDEAMAKESAK